MRVYVGTVHEGLVLVGASYDDVLAGLNFILTTPTAEQLDIVAHELGEDDDDSTD
jgi:hypothetical protein